MQLQLHRLEMGMHRQEDGNAGQMVMLESSAYHQQLGQLRQQRQYSQSPNETWPQRTKQQAKQRDAAAGEGTDNSWRHGGRTGQARSSAAAATGDPVALRNIRL